MAKRKGIQKEKGKEVESVTAKEAPAEEATIEVTLPRGVDKEMYDAVEKIIVSGFKADQTPDAIKSAIFSSGVPFSKMTKLYSLITKAAGLVVDPKAVTEAIVTELKNYVGDLTYEETYSQLLELSAVVSEEVKGATPQRVIAVLKKIFKEQEKEFPRKPAPSRGKIGIINKTIIDCFKKNKEATQDELEAQLRKVTKTPSNANDYAKQFHKMAYALTNGLSTLEVLTVFSKDNKDTPADE